VEPENASICKGETATFNCGYFLNNTQLELIPQWIINKTNRLSMMDIVNGINNLGPLQWIVDGNDTNTTRLLVGPVDERYIGKTTFQCEIPVPPTPRSENATLTVIG